MAAERVLVTGTAGFLGSYLVPELLRRGYEVVGVDDESKYGPVERPFDDDPRFTRVVGDARDADVVRAALDGCDHFIALAAMIGGIAYFHERAYDLLAANERLTAAACDAAIDAHRTGQLQKLTYVSSAVVYESALPGPSVEGDELRIAPPRSSYGFQKLAVEYFARAARAQHGLPYTIVRPFNTVGIGELRTAGVAAGAADTAAPIALTHVVPDLVRKVLAGQDPLHLLGSGRQVRHYTAARDVAAGMVIAMAHPDSLDDDFNLASPTGTSVLQLADAIWRRLRPGEELRYECDDPFAHDVAERVPSVAKARDRLGFEATTTLDEILDEVVPWVVDAVDRGLV
ncbi:MAG: NAD-dependent epimerase/dehydratase family protein [Acidimicrobiia bacterium]